jgi:F0F1-type ATP synthase gamma subunit
MLESVAPSVKFSYCNLPDALTEPQEMLELVKSLVQYSNIIIYHGLFKSILHQEPQNTFVTGEVFKIESTITEKKVGFLFEPSVEFIAEYFEKQILSVLIEQTLYEASLSKFASRMLSLDTASQNISTRMDALVLKYHKLKYKEINERIQASLSGGTLWK